MKVKTSITLSEELLKAIDQFSGQYKNRSDFLEVDGAGIDCAAAAGCAKRQRSRDSQSAG